MVLLTSGAYRKNVTHDADRDVLRVDARQFSADDEVSILDEGLQRRLKRGGPTLERPLGLGPQVFKYLIEATLEVVEIAKRTPRAKTSHNDLLLYGCCNSNETLLLHYSPAAIISGHVRNDAACFNGLANCNGSTRFTRSGPAARRAGRGRTAISVALRRTASEVNVRAIWTRV